MIRAITLSLVLCLTWGALPAGPIELEKSERDRLKKETVYAIDLIQRYHYKQKSFAEIDPEELLLQYIDNLDSSRIVLLQEDVDFALDRFAGSLKPSYLYVGDLYPAFEIYNLYYNRISERLTWVQDRLEEPFDLESDATLLTDRDEVPWPQTMAEADRLWEKRLTHELILELLDDATMEDALSKIAKRYERMAKFMDEIEVHDVQQNFLTSLAQLYDPHSNFFSWDSAQEFDIQLHNELVGIGAQLRDVEGYCVIERLIPGGPAEMSGRLHPGDKIIGVAQGDGEAVDVVGMKLRKIVHMIRGETGTEVRLTVMPAHSAKRKIVPLIREKVELTATLASAEIHELESDDGTSTKVGVIDLPTFYGRGAFGDNAISTSKDVEELINKLKAKGVEGIVLDLRNNPGGLLVEAVKLTGLFISKGPVVMQRSFDGEVEEEWDRDVKVAWDGPLVILVSRSSASASEIVAGTLQSLGRAVVVGDEATHGKGTVQAQIDLRNYMRSMPFSQSAEMGTVKITMQQYYLPNGDSTQNRGVLSDITLPSANMFLFDGEADLENALSWDQIAPIVYELPERDNQDFAMVQDSLLEDLARKSQQRQETLEEFSFLKKNIAWFKERHDTKRVSLNLEERRQEREQVEAMRDFFDERRDDLSGKLSYQVKAVELDLTQAKEDSHQEKLRSTPLPTGESRANKFYQKVFYYQADEDEKIHDIWVEYFDYDKAVDEAESIAAILTESSGIEITPDEAGAILTLLKNLDRGAEFNILSPFREVLGDRADDQALLDAMPDFFTKMVEVDPDILLERPKLDVPLRESLRIVHDWIEEESPLNPTRIAAKVAAKENSSEEEEAVVTR